MQREAILVSKLFHDQRPCREVGLAHFFFGPDDGSDAMTDLGGDIERRLERLDPRIEMVALEQPATDALRLFIDHPDGVDLGLCERVTNELRDLLVDHSIEVSSPGAERPLTKPEHFRRFRGHKVRVRTREPLEGRRSFTGRIADADDRAVEVALPDGAVTIPHERIRRSNLVPEVSPK
jgi:ribosome maturation factor RimP